MSTPAHSSASPSRAPLGGDSHARRLLEFARRLAERPLPPPLAAQAKRCLLDNLGCGLFGANQPWSRIMRAEIESDAASGECTVFGDARTTAAAAASLANGTCPFGIARSRDDR